MNGDSVEQARLKINSRLSQIERVKALAKEFSRIRAMAETGWIAFGDEPWLINVTLPAAPLPGLVFVVSGHYFASPSTVLVAKSVQGSEPLGEGFAGLHVLWQPGRFEPMPRVPVTVYATGVALIVGLTIVAGYVLLRDVSRDLRMAELRTHFLASVSHELRTPLTAVRMFAETLVMGRTADEHTRREYLESIVNESERLTRLVDNVLEFSKIEHSTKAYRMQPIRLPDVVRSAARLMQYPLAQQGFLLKLSIDETLEPVSADSDAIEQAILNLLSNAMKYSGSAREIQLGLASNNGDAVIAVTDRGFGIAPEEQSRIFEKFYRVRTAETDAIGGAGLGLALVKHIAEAHRGNVEVRSTIGKGSTFILRIPSWRRFS